MNLVFIAFGPQELLVVGGLIVLLFGARKLPELARSLGSSVTQFKKGLKESDGGDATAQIPESPESSQLEEKEAP